MLSKKKLCVCAAWYQNGQITFFLRIYYVWDSVILCGCGGSSNSGDHISNNQIFTVVTIVIVLKCISFSSLTVECGQSFWRAC